MASDLHKSFPLVLVFFKAPFLVLYLSYYILITLMLLSVMFLTMVIILLSTLSAIVLLIFVQQIEFAFKHEFEP